MESERKVKLGFADEEFPAGTHICQVYCDDEERDRALLAFLVEGLVAKEKSACFSERVSRSRLEEAVAHLDLSVDAACERGDLTLSGVREVYFQDDRFDAERMLALLEAFHTEAVRGGYPAARVIGEMTTEIQDVEGGSRLLEYESRVSLLLRERPVTAVCQYDARSFDGATIMDVLTVHPLMVVRGAVVRNPFYVPPEEFLA